ncbi:PEP/pyruvate-binding domain-containing protein [Frankia tisae]|uniref:PEP/pyruvate-binding domain-containing protein n=1 Tax=Frankia tisae TaxID=2950104 RepID=UPI0021BE2D0D|nr:PEP/pyruvate-binding domain-containing protein [Frankia tisae]
MSLHRAFASVLTLGAPGTERDDLVGAKAAALARLAAAAPVPPGFCVTALDPRRVPDPTLERDIRRAYESLAAERPLAVAVRSSALDEDGAAASFAGIHDTFLNVVGADDVVAAVWACARSAVADVALAYRARLGVPGEVRIAVLVQVMVPADVSFVAFSSNPLPKHDGAELVVSAARGLGAVIADGTARPDTYRLLRDTRETIEHRRGDQSARLVASAGGGVATEPLPARERAEPPLDSGALREVTELVLRIERLVGQPVDVEGARVGDSLFVLQARPITRTTHFPLDGLDEEATSWLREDIHFPAVVTPMGGDYARLGMYAGLRRMQDELGWTSRADAVVFNGRVYVRWHYMSPVDELDEARRRLEVENLERARTVVARWHRTVVPRLRAIYAEIGCLDVDGPPGRQRVAAWRAVWSVIEEAWYWHFVVLYPCFAGARHLAATCRDLFGEETAANAWRLTVGRVETMHQVEVDLWTLAEIQRAASATDAGEDLARALDRCLAAHGHLGAESDDLAATTWADEPWRVPAEARRMGAADVSPGDRRAATLAAGNALLAELRGRVADEADRTRLDEAVALARAVFPLVEDHNYWLDRMLHATTRAALLRVGARCVADEVLERADDIWYLHVDEVADVMAGPQDRRELVRRRRDEWRDWSRLMPAVGPVAAAVETEERAGVALPAVTRLRGVAASPGVAVGVATVVRTSADAARAPAGGVLVCPNTNMSWVALMARAGGLVTSAGGELSHGAIVARELGIPAVVGVRGALDVIADGMLVEVDGAAGVVRIVAGGDHQG